MLQRYKSFLLKTYDITHSYPGCFGNLPARQVFLDSAPTEITGYLHSYIIGIKQLKAVQY